MIKMSDFVMIAMKRFISCLVVALVVNSSSFAQDKSTPKQPVLVDAIVAVVNTDVITLKELDDRVRLVEQRLQRQNTQMPPREVLQRQLLERMIVTRAQMQLARDSGIRVDDIMLDRAVSRIAEQNQLSLQTSVINLSEMDCPSHDLEKKSAKRLPCNVCVSVKSITNYR